MNILIVTHVFPPLNVIGAQRTYSWAKYWSKLGHSVYVLTTQKELFDGFIDPEFDFQGIQSVNIEEIKYWPFSNHKIAHSGGVPGRSGMTHDLLSKIRSISKMARQRLGMGAVLSVRNLWIRPAVSRGVSLHGQHDFDCIVSSYGPPAPHLVASQLQKALQIPWVADYRDLWHGNHYQDAAGVFSFIQKYIEDRTVARASLLTTVSDPLRDTLAARFCKETLTIENGFDVDEVDQAALACELKNRQKISLVYTGTVRRGKQCVVPLFEAIKALSLKKTNLSHQLEVLFYGRELGEVPYLIDDYGVSQIVKISGFVNRNEILGIQKSADALIFLDWKDTRIDGILSGKIFEYLYSGTPILGIGSYQNLAPGRLLQESGCGVCLEQSSKRIEAILTQLLLGQPITYSPNSVILKKYSRQRLAEKMIDHISKIVSS